MKCHGCGAEKTPDANEPYPYTDDREWHGEPRPALFVVELCDEALPEPVSRACVVCQACFHTLEPDMWIDLRCWSALPDAVPPESLPPLKDGPTGWRPESYT